MKVVSPGAATRLRPEMPAPTFVVFLRKSIYQAKSTQLMKHSTIVKTVVLSCFFMICSANAWAVTNPTSESPETDQPVTATTAAAESDKKEEAAQNDQAGVIIIQDIIVNNKEIKVTPAAPDDLSDSFRWTFNDAGAPDGFPDTGCSQLPEKGRFERPSKKQAKRTSVEPMRLSR